MVKPSFKSFFEKENINYKDDAKVFSTPNRLVLCFKKIAIETHQASEEIRGPNIKAPDSAIEGFLKSNLIKKDDIYKKNTEKGATGDQFSDPKRAQNDVGGPQNRRIHQKKLFWEGTVFDPFFGLVFS